MRRVNTQSTRHFYLRRRAIISALVPLVAWLLVACGSPSSIVGVEQSGGAVGPQEIKDATIVLRFDPGSIWSNDADPVRGECVASTAVRGTYRCDLAEGGAAEPCFALSGVRLGCGPNPVAGTYDLVVSPTNTLAQVPAPPPDQLEPFFVELDGDVRTCRARTGAEPVIIGGVAATYDCDAPYAFLLGFEKSAPTWEAALYTLDPATGSSPSGKVPMRVLRAWVP